MADSATATKDDQSTLKIPADIAKKFANLVKLIKSSRSMDDGERQYWIDVLPIMSEDQIQNLRDILDNEKEQLAEAEAAYTEGVQTAVKNVAVEYDEEAYREKKRARREAEKLHEQEEREHEVAILKELENL